MFHEQSNWYGFRNTEGMAKESQDGQQRSEQPTGKRRRDARAKGQVAKSTEVSTAFLFFGSILAFYFYIPKLATRLAAFAHTYLNNVMIWDGTRDSLIGLMHSIVYRLAGMLLPIFLVFVAIGIISNFVQIGFLVSPESIKPKFSKLNPITGIKQKFFSLRALEMLGKNLVLLVVIAAVAYRAIKREIPALPPLVNCDPSVIVLTIFQSVMHLMWDALWIFIIIAIADYIFQKWQYKQDLMMTKQEIKEEMKHTEGNPQIKSKIRSIQLQMARRRMLQDVPKANVVITNPTHLAVALQYDRGNMIAPVVLAKGTQHLAEKIKDIARSSSVPIVENKPLAQALYKSVEIGDVIPEDLYKAVAEILAYIYSLKTGA